MSTPPRLPTNGLFRHATDPTKLRRTRRTFLLQHLEQRLLLASDFGDAPLPYPTTLAENGAQHVIGGALRLGDSVDDESDGTHSPAADADGADEDGVSFGVMMVGALDASVTVNVQGAAGQIDAWIDFNGDGSWGGPGEQIFDSADVVVGDNLLSFDVPATALAGTTVARFRVSSAGGLGVDGVAADGEVEDYSVTIVDPATSLGVFSLPNTIGAPTDDPSAVQAADIDGDGDLDVLAAYNPPSDSRLVWFENDGNQGFTEHLISNALSLVRDAFAVDVDGDGDMDALAASETDDRIIWLENDGTQTFTAHTISSDADGARRVSAADLDADGDMDVLSGSRIDNKVAWYENDGSQNFTEHTITTSTDQPVDIITADIDGDGDLDVLSASERDDRIAWYENDGSQVFTAHDITTTADRVWSVFATDLDEDGDTDVLSASFGDDTIAWYENDGSQNFTVHAIGVDVDMAEDVVAADLDGDGDLDVLAAAKGDGQILWYRNDGSQNFTKHTISTEARGANRVATADFDGDGDLDALGAANYIDTIAWYENVNGFDFGDAPLPYPTTQAEDGPRHIASGPQLGSLREIESDGAHSAAADADGAEEDGVSFGTLIVGQLDASVTVDVQNDGGWLDAWIDFNGDGSWGGPGERIFDTQHVGTGTTVLYFDVPSYTVAGDTYARFRISNTRSLGPVGLALDGEVEDYQVTIENPVAASAIFPMQHTVSTSADAALSASAADVDQDGDMDLLSASQFDDRIAWYENDGSENFTTHTISDLLGGASDVVAADVDGDGDVDVLGAGSQSGKVVWYQNDGSQNFTPHIIDGSAGDVVAIFPADLDGDGDLDVLKSVRGQDLVQWLENEGNQSFTRHTISSAVDGPKSVFGADVDGDGDLDVLSASGLDDRVAWYENDGSQNFTQHTITTTLDGASSVFCVDIDGDGDFDVVAGQELGSTVVWYENDGSQNFAQHTIGTGLPTVLGVFVADADGDGDLDVYTASTGDDRIALHVNDGDQNFTTRTITTAADRAKSVFAADVDGDGDLDAISASSSDDRIAWYENIIALDFGDAPLPYPTTLAENGAHHVLGGPTLGTAWDFELDGAHSPTADGDDTSGATPDDEDGVTEIATAVQDDIAETTSSFAVMVTGSGKLDAWIDFNQDGSWDDPGERIASSEDVSEGLNILSFSVPTDAAVGDTVARFRISTAGGLDPTGQAADGEVEDHRVTIADGALSPATHIHVVGGQVGLGVQLGDMVAWSAAHTLFEAPLEDVGSCSVQGTSIDETVTLDVGGQFSIPVGGISVGGGGGSDSLVIIGDGGAMDMTDPLVSITDIAVIDTSSTDVNVVTIDAAAIAQMAPSTRLISILGGEDDRFILPDADDWRMATPFQQAGSFYLTADNSNVGGSESIEALMPHPWQNFIRFGDVDNSGDVTALDALLIINELSRRAFSDQSTQNLHDPLTVATWPDRYFDHTGDDRVTALDALRVINDLARISNAAPELVIAPLWLPTALPRDPVITAVGEDRPTPLAAVALTAAAADRRIVNQAWQPEQPETGPEEVASAVDQLLADRQQLEWLISATEPQ